METMKTEEITTVTFNVGGECFMMSRALLDSQPKSVLAKSASKATDSKSQIFMDRDPTLFRHVLSYLRDKKISLPITVTKAAVLSELNYYCLDYDKSAIDDSLTTGIQNIRTLNQGYQMHMDILTSIEKNMKEKQQEVDNLAVAKLSIETYLQEKGKAYTKHAFKVNCKQFKEVDVSMCNETLAKTGLSLVKRAENKFCVVEMGGPGNEKELPPMSDSDNESVSESESEGDY
jgi:hypothetical protein